MDDRALAAATGAPLPLRALLGLARPAAASIRLDPRALVDAAQRATGLSDWGDDGWREGFDRLLASADAEARLNLVGRIALRRGVSSFLRGRLRLVDATARAASLPEPRAPLVIAALPRTGSSLLQQLLATHPDALSVPLWLGLAPLPAPGAAEWRAGGSWARRAAARRTELLVRALEPAMMTKHPNGPDLPVECGYWMMSSFRSLQWWALFPLYGYAEWFARADPLPGYAALRSHLQLVQQGLPGDHWVLKSPGHFLRPEAVRESLPGARIVRLHRDPVDVLASTRSLFATAHGLVSDHVDHARVAAINHAALAEAADAAVARRDPDVLDVRYDELVARPLAVVRRIHAWAGIRHDDDVEEALRARLAAARDRGAHRYRAEELVDVPAVRARFADYDRTFVGTRAPAAVPPDLPRSSVERRDRSLEPARRPARPRWWPGLLAFARAALRRDFVEGLVAAQDALGAEAFERLAERMAEDPSGRALLAERPRLRMVDAPAVRDAADGTLGNALWRHIADNGLLREPVIPASPYPESPEAAYAKARWRETHDLRHALLGLGVGVPDESLLHAFQLGQHFHPFSLVITLFGPLYGWREQSPLVTWSRAREAWDAGRRAALTANVRYEDLLDAPLAEVRARLGVRSLAHLASRPRPGPPRTGRALHRATWPWAREQRTRTWLELGATGVVHALGLTLAVGGGSWPLQLVGSAILALTALRLFAFLHDYEHGAIFRGSRAGPVVIHAIGALTCVPPRVWREFHQRHHRTTAVPLPADAPDLRGGDLVNRLVDARAWAAWSPARRRLYRLVRHPLALAAGWLVHFVIGANLAQLARDPRRNAPAALTLAAHLGGIAALGALGGARAMAFAGLVPAVLAAAVGAWLVQVQHAFPGVVYQDGDWDPVDAAIRGTSFLDLPAPLRWFTGNVGYHHVHHLNPKIPFYRLPEVAAALPELGAARRITLSWRDLRDCARVLAWHPSRGAIALPLDPSEAS